MSAALTPQQVFLRGVGVARTLADVTLELAPGERVALLGRNGVGKSTLLRVLAGLRAPDGGTVHRLAPVGYVPQAFAASLLPWYTVEENIALSDGRKSSAALERVLATVPLDRAFLGRYPYTLSGGEQQLVALARALYPSPRLLLLDEPFSALDLRVRPTVCQAIARFLTATPRSAFLVTHDLRDAMDFAARAVVLAGSPGQVVYDGVLDAASLPWIEGLLVKVGPGDPA